MLPSKLFSKVLVDIPGLAFEPSNDFHWQPESKTVWFVEGMLETNHGQLLLAHELGHAKLAHSEFSSDLDLLKKEVQAWAEAKKIAKTCKIKFDENLAEDCLNSYRHWLDKRSTCPNCSQTGYQTSANYHCINCNHRWRVSSSQTTRVCRLASA